MKIQLDKIALEYELDGPQEAPVLMLHHSLATSHMMWEELSIALAQHYRVLRYDVRGHGLSDAPEGPYTFSQLATDAVDLMAALHINKAIHVGISMGGMVSQYLAIAAPDKVTALALVSTTSNMPFQAAPIWDQRMADARATGMAPMVDPTIQRWFTKDFRDSGDSVIGDIAELIAKTPVTGFCSCAAAIRDLALTALLSKISVPTLVLVGADDPGTPPDMARDIAENIAGAKLQIFDNASHMLPIQQPERFLETLIDFVEDLDEAV